VLVIDEYLAVDVTLGDWLAGLPDDDTLGLPASRHFRLLQRIHQPGRGQLTGVLGRLSPAGRQAMRYPHPEVLQGLDPHPPLDEAASIGARYQTGGLLIVETLAAGLAFGHQLWFGTERNLGPASPNSPQTSASTSTSSTNPEQAVKRGMHSSVVVSIVRQRHPEPRQVRPFAKLVLVDGGGIHICHTCSRRNRGEQV